ncbi:hypothetical protein BpHYR1_000947 [Brachionus plicatilis]|uniref:Uncharacterized protein n=1 Tax=Brachionus plicatilis TaxID=10195 RepID=A0A3M7RSR7_BRAPC|nr:hypothetical protein BpHYR1_000947 [Brachionus plicatilis]
MFCKLKQLIHPLYHQYTDSAKFCKIENIVNFMKQIKVCLFAGDTTSTMGKPKVWCHIQLVATHYLPPFQKRDGYSLVLPCLLVLRIFLLADVGRPTGRDAILVASIDLVLVSGAVLVELAGSGASAPDSSCSTVGAEHG